MIKNNDYYKDSNNIGKHKVFKDVNKNKNINSYKNLCDNNDKIFSSARNQNSIQTLEQLLIPYFKKDYDHTPAKSLCKQKSNDLIQPIMRFKPRIELERVLDEINKNSFGRADKSIIEKQLSKLDTFNNSKLNHHHHRTQSERLDESVGNFMSYINSQNRIAIMKMIHEKTLDKYVKKLKKDEKDVKIILDENNLEYKKNNKQNINELSESQDKNKFKNKKKIIDNSEAKKILKEFHRKTYFNAVNIIATDSRLKKINDKLKDVEKYDKSINKILNRKNMDNNSEEISEESSIDINRRNPPLKKKIYSANYKNNNRGLNSNFHLNDSKENKIDNKNKIFNKTLGNFFKNNKNLLSEEQNNSNTVEKILMKFQKNLSNEQHNQSVSDDDNPLFYNIKFNNIRKKQSQAENVDSEKLKYLKNLAFSSNRKFVCSKNDKNNNTRIKFSLEKSPTFEKNIIKSKDPEDSDDDLQAINKELKNSFNKPPHNRTTSKKEINKDENSDFNNFLTSPVNSESKMEEIARLVVKKCNFTKSKNKNNNKVLESGNGKLMITSGLSVKEFLKKFQLS